MSRRPNSEPESLLKRKPGRPLVGLERKRRINVVLSPEVAEQSRTLGYGNLSAGIERAARVALGLHTRSEQVIEKMVPRGGIEPPT